MVLGFCQFLRGQAMGLERFWQERDGKNTRRQGETPPAAGVWPNDEAEAFDALNDGEGDDRPWRFWGRGLRLMRRPLGPAPVAGDLVAWLAVFLWAGAALWFIAPVRPGLLLSGPVAGLFLLLGIWQAARTGQRGLLLLAAACVGFALVSWRVLQAHVRLLPAHVGWVTLTGQVERTWHAGPGRVRMILRVKDLPEVRRRFVPQRVRITLLIPKKRSGKNTRAQGHERLPLPGDVVRLRARLKRLPQPVEPEGFDPARAPFFAGIGAVGFAHARGLFLIEDGCKDCGLALLGARYLERWRRAIAGRLRAVMRDDNAAALAAALIIGERGRLAQAHLEALRAAGLAHILAISGLHLALVAGAVFQALRFLLAAIPGLAIRYPIRKWAALAALLTAAAYLLLSGNSVATQRAFIMLAVMTLALMLDRPALSMRNLGLAALLILILHPEKAVTAGFQMSFFAVAGLIAVYEAVRHVRLSRMVLRAEADESRTLWQRWLRGLLLGFLAFALTTLVAALMTALPSAWHFNRLSHWGLFGNVLALPVVSLVVMPAGVLALVLMPLHLDAPVWQVMEAGLKAVFTISGWIAHWPDPWLEVPQMRLWAAALIAAGLLWLCLRRDGWRLVGLGAVVAGVLAPAAVRPDVLVDAQGKVVAVRNAAGQLLATPGRAGRFALSIWLRRDGDPATPKEARKRKGWRCAPSGACRTALIRSGQTGERGRTIVFLPAVMERRLESNALKQAIAQACADAAIVIAAFPLREGCKEVRVRIDRFVLWRQGAQALWLDEAGRIVRHLSVSDKRGTLPWGRAPLPRKAVRADVPADASASRERRMITDP